jgi:3alpha(or 20beta)-hydroxysteroid dehydrogenase
MGNILNTNDLTGKVALITGGARGIGASVAEHMANAGAAAVIITDLLDREGEEQASVLGSKYSSRVMYMHQDVTGEDAWAQTVRNIVSEAGGLDILVNNAGIEIAKTIENYSYSDYKKQMAVNSDGVFLGCREAVRAMKPGGIAGNGGSIINLSSIAGLVGLAGFTVYGGAKGFVRLLTKHLAVECGRLKYGIRVNSVHPGLIETAMGDQVFDYFVEMGFAETTDEATAAVKEATPLGTTGRVEDVAAAIVYLASDAASYVTGLELAVDGGWSAS